MVVITMSTKSLAVLNSNSKISLIKGSCVNRGSFFAQKSKAIVWYRYFHASYGRAFPVNVELHSIT